MWAMQKVKKAEMQVTVKPDVADDETISSIRAVTTRSQSKQNAEPPSGCNSESMKENVWASDQVKVKIRSFQEKDTELSTILKALEAEKKPAHSDIVALSPAARYYWSIWDSLSLKDGCVYRHFYRKDATGSHLQFVVPRHLIVPKYNDIVFRVQLSKWGVCQVLHHNKMKPYKGDNIPRWITRARHLISGETASKGT